MNIVNTTKVCLLLHVSLLLLITTSITNRNVRFVSGCHELEREALLKLKGTVQADISNQLSSWKGEHCCQWRGVTCHNVSRHVTHLDLHTDITACLFNYGYFPYKNRTKCERLRFNSLDPCLLELKELSYLDLSGNEFGIGWSYIPEFVGSMKNLRYLNLSNTGSFTGKIPPKLGNLTRLQTLDLGGNWLEVKNLQWLSTLVDLRYLDLSGNIYYDNFHTLMQDVTTLPSLTDLRLRGIRFNTFLDNRPLTSLRSTSIHHLDLSKNYLGGQFPNFLSNFSFLVSLDLSHNSFVGSLPYFLSNMSYLKSIDLSSNYFEGVIPLWLKTIRGLEAINLGRNLFHRIEGGSIMGILGNSCNLKVLNFSYNNLLGDDILSPYYANYSSKCSSYDLEILDLSFGNITSTLPYWLVNLKKLKRLALEGNRFNGPIPQFIGNLSLLEELNLRDCDLNGSIPSSLGKLLSMNTLDLSSNSLEGFLFESHFSNLSNLQILDLSFNPLNFNINSNWLPKFKLIEFRMRSCRIEGIFPQWLRTQRELRKLDLSENKIYRELPWWFPSPNLSEMNLSHNHIVGPIPQFHSSSQLSSIDLSYNSFSGLINNSLCLLRNLYLLDLQRNQFSGAIPDCWGNSQGLFVIDLSSNRLSGNIPMSIGLLPNLAYLKLNNNSLIGAMPKTLNVASILVILDLGENKLTGEVPNWGESTHPVLQILRLHANQFNGVIPPKLCLLPQIKFLDLALNNLTGSIPQCFGYFKSMKSSTYNLADFSSPPYSNGPLASGPAMPPESPEEENAMVVFKGAERQYTSTLKFLVDLDLSCNGFVGSIPLELTQLYLLKSLNLSFNNLIGPIPNEIGKMASIESLDLSNNHLSGTIPSSLSAITSLSSLNLSCNNLHGEIPTGSQLQTLNDPSIYADNVGLCGDPLPPCGSPHGNTGQEQEDDDGGESKFEKVMFILVVMLGFATGFWGVVGSLLLKKTWRSALFGSVEKMTDFMYVQVVVRIKRLVQ